MVLGRGSATWRLKQIALQYPPSAETNEAIVQDFHSFRQALNVASADQRVLVLVNAADAKKEADLRQSFRAVANDERVIGRFHIDFERGDAWKKSIEGTSDEPGIILINPGEFGLSGKAMKQLPLDAPSGEIIDSMLEANTTFAKSTEKKVYSTHVAKGQRAGVYFEGAVEYGEDRDGDGQIDRGRRGRGPRSGPRRGR